MEKNEGNDGDVGRGKSASGQPELTQVLTQILDRLERLEASVGQIEAATRELPNVASAAVDAVDGHVAAMQARGIDVDARMAAGLSLVEKVTEPATLAALENLIGLVDAAPGTIAMIADMVDGVANRIHDSGIDIDERLASTLELGEKMTARATVDGLSGVLHPGAVSIVGMLGGALVSCYEECMTLPEPRAYGPVKAMAQLRNPDVRRSLAFLLNVSRFFGHEMKEKHAEIAAHRAAEAANQKIAVQ